MCTYIQCALQQTTTDQNHTTQRRRQWWKNESNKMKRKKIRYFSFCKRMAKSKPNSQLSAKVAFSSRIKKNPHFIFYFLFSLFHCFCRIDLYVYDITNEIIYAVLEVLRPSFKLPNIYYCCLDIFSFALSFSLYLPFSRLIKCLPI